MHISSKECLAKALQKLGIANLRPQQEAPMEAIVIGNPPLLPYLPIW